MSRSATILEVAAGVLLVSGLMMMWIPLGVLALAVIFYLLSLAMEAPP